MRKLFVCPLSGLILSALATGTAHAQLTSLTEGFDTVGSSGPPATGIFASGWVITNNSSPLGNHDWGQGIPPGQTDALGANAQSGAPNSFIQTDFNAGLPGSAIVSDWLITPVLLLENGATMSFYTQASPANTQFPNELQVWESQSGSSTVNVGSTAPNPGGDFTVKLLDINPGATNPSGSTGGYPTTWTQFTFTISGLSAPTDGRFGFRFYLPNNNTDGTIVGIDTFSFAAPTVFTRTVSGNWTDTTGWTPNGVPNGNTVVAQLVTPSSGANSVNLGGGTFTLNQLQFFGTGAGTWDVVNGTIVFDGTNPTFVNQGGSSGIVGLLPSLQLNANTTFQIDNASAVTEVTGAISGTGGLTKTGSGALVLIGTNTYSGGTTISAGTLQIGNGGTSGSIVGNVADNGTLAFDRSDTVAFGSVISGTGSLVQLGSGTLVLTGNSTYTGGTTISAGTLQIGNGGTTGGITGNVTDNGTLAFNRSDAVTFAGTISGTGSLAQLGSGTVTLTGNNTYSGGTTISAGTLQIGNGGTSGSIAGNVIDNGTLAFDRSDAVTFGGAISGTGSLAQLGSGTVILTGNSTYTGGTTVSAGTLQIGNGGTSGSISGPVTDNGTLAFDRSDAVIFAGAIGGTGSVLQLGSGTVTLTGNSTYAGGTTISAGTLQIGNGGTTGGITGNVTDNGTLAFNRSDAVTFSGVITGAGSLVQLGSGALVLTANHTYSGGTTISAGTLQLGNGGTSGSIIGNVIDNGTLAFDRSDAVTFSGAISGTGSLVQLGSNTLTLTGNSTYTGNTTIGVGTLQLGNGGTSGSISGPVTDNGTLAFDRSNAVIFAGAIGGTGSVLQLGSGTVTLTGNSTYAGGTTISAGTLQIGNGGTSGSITGIVTDNGILGFDRSDAVTFSGVITGAGTLVQLGSGALVLTANHTYSGGTTISAGTLQLGNGGTSGSIIGNVTDNGTLAFDRSDSFTFTGAISGTGTVDQIGTGTLTLTGNNTYSGPTNVSSGTLRAGSATAFSANSAFNVTGLSVLDLNGFDVSIGSLTGAAGATVSLGTHTLTAGGDNSSTTYAGLITGTGGLTKVGTGTLTLSGTSAYTGLTNINAGVLVGGALNSLSSFSDFVIANAASLDISLADQTIGSLAGTGGATVNLGTHILTTGGNDTSTTYAGLITGSGGLTKVGLGTLTLSGTSIYGGATNINAGVLAGGLPNALSQFSAFVIANGALLDIGVADQTIGSLAGAAGAFVNLGAHTLTTGGNNTSTLFAGTILGLGGGGLVKIGTGIFTLAGANTYSGGTTISNGTLQIGNGGTSGSITGNVTDNGTLAFDRSDIVTFSGVISGTGSLVQSGVGTLVLIANNTYLGGTTISAGTLQFGNGGTTGGVTSAAIIDNGVLVVDRSDSMTYGGVVSGTGSGVKDGSGTLTFTGDNTYSGGTTINAGTLQLGNGGTTGSITGDVTDNGTLAFDRSDSVAFGGVISGTGSLVQIGNGTLTLTGNNSYSGGTTISNGALQIGSGGTTGSIVGNVTDNGILAFDRSDSVTFGGLINGTGTLVNLGSGALILTGNNSYSGGTAVDNGTVVTASNGALGAGPVSITGLASTLQVNSGVTLTNLVTLNNGGTLNNSGTVHEGASNLNVANGGAIINNAGGIITANQIQFTLAPAILVNSGTINANLTFANFANMVQLFTGSSIVGNLNLGTHTGTDLILDGSGTELLTQAITGTVTNSGSLVKQGTGTWTLDKNLSIPVATNVLAGVLVLDGQLTSPQVNVSTGATLQFGAGGTAGNLAGNAVVDNGSVIFNRSDSLTFNANISGSGGLNQNGTGTIILGGANTYSGGTIINAGTLVVNSSQALGLGNVTLNSGTLKADPQPINVKRNYIQNAAGTLQLAVDGPNAGQYDFLNVTGNASLNGTLALANGGYNPQANDKLTLVTTGGTVTGKFAAFGNPFAHGTGYNLVDLIYGRNSVVLEFLNQTTPVSPVPPKVPTTPGAPPTVATINFSSFAQTPNQRAAASLLDPIQLDPKSAALMSYLYSQPTSRFSDDFAKISPEGLTAFYEISFSGANIQKLNLEDRLDDIRNGSNGFNSNVKINGGSVAGPEGKTTVDGKYSKNTLEPVLQSGPGNRWGVWLTGFGDFVDVDSDSNAKGYDFTTGGVSLGVDYRIIDHLAVGVMGSYSHTWTSLRPGHIGVDTGRGGIYATYFDRCFYLNGGIYGGYNSYDSSRNALSGLATGSTEGAEFSTFISGGYDFHFGHLTFGPTGSLQYTNVYIDSFSEKNSLAPLRLHSDSEESLRTDLGFRAFYRWQLGKIVLEPFLKAAWEHEFKYSALPITANLVGFSATSATFTGPAEGHDSAVVSAGGSIQWTPAISTYLSYDGQLGRDRYDSNAVVGGIRVSF